MFRTLVRRAGTRVPQRSRLAKSAASRSIAASALVGDKLFASSVVSTGSTQVSSFHTSAPTWEAAKPNDASKAPFDKLMAANRGEIATRIVRAASELGIQTAGIYAYEGKRIESFRLFF